MNDLVFSVEGRLKLIQIGATRAMNMMRSQHKPSEVLAVLETIELLARRSEAFLMANAAQIAEDLGLDAAD